MSKIYSSWFICVVTIIQFLFSESYHFRTISNSSLSGHDVGCAHRSTYFVTKHVQFPMCMGQTNQDLKNGMSIINLINSRGYLPTCRVMHLMLWMASQIHDRRGLVRDYFVDVGANIGSCSVHMAALGFPVISVEPVQQHVDTIQGSIDINPAFQLELHHNGISSVHKNIHANFGHGARNWGASEFHEVSDNSSFELALELKTLDQIIGNRRVTLLKVDCEGCEWEALKGGKKNLRRIPMIKMELVQQSYTAGNETMTPKEIVQFLAQHHFKIYYDHFNEQDLYFGKHGNNVLPIDRLFGSSKFQLDGDTTALHAAAKQILQYPLDASNFNHKEFLRQSTDIIAFEEGFDAKLRQYFLGSSSGSEASSQ